MLSRPQRAVALVSLLAHTRSEYVFLSDSLAGRALWQYFGERFLGVLPQNRLCRGVLLLPRTHPEYLRGRRRQALRTNLRRAAAAGIRCETICDPDRALDAAREVLNNRRAPITEAEVAALDCSWPVLFKRPGTTLMVATGSDGKSLALMAIVIDETVCLIRLSMASNHDARWALHDHLVGALIDRGIKYLLSEGDGPFGALGFSASVHHYQRLLGYELRHLIPVSAKRRSSLHMRRELELASGAVSRAN